jgi:hypothetical protein
MAHFAELDQNNIVLRVLVVPDSQEHRGQDFLAMDLGLGGTWVQTSYNRNIRGNFAGVGFSYLAEQDLFMPPKPFDSWLLDAENATWVAPLPYPDDGLFYAWDEQALIWVLVNDE